MPHQALCVISSQYLNSNWSDLPETAKLGFDLCDLDLWPLTLIFCVDIISVNGNNSWKFHDERWWEHGENVWRTNRHRQTHGRTGGLNQSQLKIYKCFPNIRREPVIGVYATTCIHKSSTLIFVGSNWLILTFRMPKRFLWSLLLTWFNFNPSMDK